MTCCPACGSTDLVAVDLEIGKEPVVFSHCRDCEHRWWAGHDGRLALSTVLTRVASR